MNRFNQLYESLIKEEPETRHTESPAFKKWFKDSKLVDKEGNPKIFYHGTKKPFYVFDKAKDAETGGQNLYGTGFYFFSTEFPANTYGKLMHVYLSMKNPLKTDSGGLYRSYGKKAGATYHLRDVNRVELSRLIQADGYDGVIVDSKYPEYIVFEPTQIKSATDNNGRFDVKNPDIRR